MNQNESDRDYVNNKIKEMKNRFEKKTGEDKGVDKEKHDLDLPRLRHRETKVKENISLVQNRLEEFEQKRKKNKFSDITQKFGLSTLINTAESNKDHLEIADELRRIRNSIVYKDEGNFRSKLQKFETKKPNEQRGATDHEMNNFLKETHIICENYENEIEFLRERLKEVEKQQKSFQNLEIKSNILTTEFEANMKISFLRQMKNLTEKDISFMDISNIYNEKICELFEENEKLQVLIKNQNELQNENQELKLKVQKLNEEKDSSIKNISDIYGVKFTELFEENDKIRNEIEEFKKITEAKENKLNIENKNLKEIVVDSNNQKLQYEDRIKNFEGKIKSLEENLKGKETELKEKEEKLEMNSINFQAELEEFRGANKRMEEDNLQIRNSLKEKEHEIKSMKIEYEEKSQNREKELQKLSSYVIIKETETNFLKDKLKEQEDKINSLIKHDSEGKISEEKLKEINSEHNKQLSDLNEEFKKLKERLRKADQENDDLREIITKDQITLKELKDFKIKAEINNEANNIIIEENHLLRNEIKLFKQRCEEEIGKIQDLNKKLKEKDEEKQKVLLDCALLEKKIENLNKIVEDYKEKILFLKEKEKEYENSKLDLEPKLNKNSLSDSIVLNESEVISTGLNNSETSLNENSNFNNNNSLPTEGQFYNHLANIEFNKYQINLLKIFLSDYIYYLYLYDNALNLQKIVEIILNNFNFYLGTIFNRKDNFNMPISFIHEFMEDLVLKIYDTYVSHKINEQSSKYKDLNIFLKDKNSPITQDEITIDILKKVCEEVENTNSLSNINSILKKEKSLDDIIYIFVQKYKKLLDLGFKYFSSIGITNVNAFIVKDVGQIVSQKVEKYTRGLKEQIRTLVEYVVVNIHSGKLMSNGNEIYNFKDYSAQFGKRDLAREKDTLYTKGNIISLEAIDNLVSSFKNEKALTNIIFDGVFDNKSEFTLGKISTIMMIHCNNLTDLSIINSSPTHKQLGYIVKLIENLKNLKHLDLSNNNIGDEGIQILNESLKFNKNILSINLSNNNITEKGGFYMADAMIKNQTLENLNLSNNSIKDTGLSSLLTVLTNNNTRLKTLDLSNNQFIPSDFKNVADLISNSNNLQSIDLSFNKIDQPSAYSLGLALKQAKSLEAIKLNSIDLNEEAAPLLLKNLSDCRVAQIQLDNNPFGEIGAIIFANVLKPNKYLKYVSIRRSRLTSMFMMCLSKVLLFNQSIEHINLEDNMFDEESIILMAKTIKDKNVKIHFSKSSFGNKLFEAIKNVENFVFK